MKPSLTRVLNRVIDGLKQKYGGEEEALANVIELGVLVASSDGMIDPVERDALAMAIEQIVGAQLSPLVVKHLIGKSVSAIRRQGIEVRAKMIGATLASHDAIDEGLVAAIAIAYASDLMNDDERKMIHWLARACGADDRIGPLLERTLAEVTADG